ncbi:Lrp/AsnC family transcriptional regulator [Candidatus Woesearchaeota archaeon]|nr:Lrp/AsnC family transcriptional regulator [Candidatus Woesearchaeota archaeon]
MNKDGIIEIDDTDQKILNELLVNAKAPLRKIASTLRVSFVTVMERIKRMEEQGVILGYTPRINYETLGYGVNVQIEVRISKGKLIELEKKIAKSPNVSAVYDTTGDFDATIIAKFKTTRGMDNFLKHIQTFDFVERTNTKLILNTIKEEQIRV